MFGADSFPLGKIQKIIKILSDSTSFFFIFYLVCVAGVGARMYTNVPQGCGPLGILNFLFEI